MRMKFEIFMFFRPPSYMIPNYEFVCIKYIQNSTVFRRDFKIRGKEKNFQVINVFEIDERKFFVLPRALNL